MKWIYDLFVAGMGTNTSFDAQERERRVATARAIVWHCSRDREYGELCHSASERLRRGAGASLQRWPRHILQMGNLKGTYFIL